MGPAMRAALIRAHTTCHRATGKPRHIHWQPRALRAERVLPSGRTGVGWGGLGHSVALGDDFPLRVGWHDRKEPYVRHTLIY